MRTTTEISAEARELIETSSTKFVPPSLVRIGELCVEFMESADAALATKASADELVEIGQAVTHAQSDIEALKATVH